MREKTGGNRLIVVLLILTLIVLIGTAATFGYLYFFKSNKPVNISSKSSKVLAEKTLPLDEFIVNLANENKSFLKITIVLAYTDKKLEKEIPNKMPQMRNEVIKTLRQKTSDDFSNGGEDKVISEILGKLNELLTSGELTNIYLNDIIIQ